MEQGQLKFALEAATVTVRYDWPQGWHLTVALRRCGQTWDEAVVEVYDRLASEEVPQVLEAVFEVALGL